jgi:hypothetical protein
MGTKKETNPFDADQNTPIATSLKPLVTRLVKRWQNFAHDFENNNLCFSHCTLRRLDRNPQPL